ncbi:unnamed protein product [Ectocarpus sp. 12 AP-2014]
MSQATPNTKRDVTSKQQVRKTGSGSSRPVNSRVSITGSRVKKSTKEKEEEDAAAAVAAAAGGEGAYQLFARLVGVGSLGAPL